MIVARGAAAALLLTAATNCGNGGSDPDLRIQVAGSYPTAVTLKNNTCGTVQVAPQTTTVVHESGATTFRMTHGPVSYTGQLQVTGEFTAGPSIVVIAGETSNITIAGRFTRTELIATASVGVSRTGGQAPCGYQVDWLGTKSGAPNVIP